MQTEMKVSEESIMSFDVSGVKAKTPFLQAKNFNAGKTLIGVKITEIVAYNPASERKETINGQEVTKKYKENWVIGIDFENKSYLLRLNNQMICAIRDAPNNGGLGYGGDMQKWVNQKIALVVVSYGALGSGFQIVV